MEKIDLYVAEVGQYLPRSERADIEREIRSLIEDTLEARSQSEGRTADESMVNSVLKEFGSPKKMAASYQPPRYLIGPRFYDAFLMTLQIVLAIVGMLALIGLGLALGNAGSLTVENIVKIFTDRIVEFFQSALAILGNVVLVFAIIEFFSSRSKTPEKEESWDPRSLKARSVEEKVSPVAMVIGIIGSAALILVFNFFPQALGYVETFGGRWHILNIFTAYFYQLLPLWTGLWVLQIALDAMLLAMGRWSNAMRWFYIAVQAFSMAILMMVLTGAPIFELDTTIPGFDALTPLLYTGFRSFLILVLVLEGIDVVKTLVKITRTHEVSPLAA